MPHRQFGPTLRSPYEWLAALQRAKAEAIRGNRSRVTIADVIDRAADPKNQGSLEPTSPRSVEACLRLGIEPHELHFIPIDSFVEQLGSRELADIAHKHHEGIRQERLAALVEERTQITDSGVDLERGNPFNKEDTSNMVEREAKRLEMMKRRQEREMNQLIQFEVLRKAMQDKAEAKLASLEAKSEAQRRERAAAEAEWREQQRERDIWRAQQGAEREKEIKALEAERFAKEIEAQRLEAQEEQTRRKAAYAHEQERRNKVEEARAEAERALKAQAADLERKKADMARRDAERERIKAAQMEAATAAAQEAQRKTAARIVAALEASEAQLRQRRAAFDERQAHVELRNLHKEELRRADEAGRRAHEVEADAARKAAFGAAMQRERERVDVILTKQWAKDEKLEALRQERERNVQRTKLVHNLDLDLKRTKVAAMQRKDVYRRDQSLRRIQAETERAYGLVGQREALRVQRKMANMNASFQRERLMGIMEKLKAKKNFAQLGTGDNR